MDTRLVIGLDVGSTTVKGVVVDPGSRAILWSDYRRHHTRQPECVRELLLEIGERFADVPRQAVRIFVTGSGGAPLAEPLGARFVQEVNAVTLAVESLHPDAGSVVELGGQDAKIIVFKTNESTGQKTALCSMNDKCASGTGATIDKCTIKVGMAPEALAALRFDPSRLHHVAAKCGVFAETDIVNLVKSGIPAPEIMCSLADAIVAQNLSVLTRGHTLRPRVILLGGPNTYLPFLQDAWRLRIREIWDERGFDYPRDRPLEELIVVPPNAQLYAAYGAVVYGLGEPDVAATYAGLDALERYCAEGRKARLAASAGPGLVRNPAELEAFRTAYRIPPFEPPALEPGSTVRAAIGLDGGSTSSKAVLLSEDGTLLRKAYVLSKGNPIEDMRELLARLRDAVRAEGASLEVVAFGATGYAADVLEQCLLVDVNLVETVAHMMSARHFFGDIDVICDIGGQDIKVLFMENGDIKSFKLSNQCSAGNGMLLQAMADQFGIPVTAYADTAFAAELAPKFSYGCAVFLDTDRVNFQKEGFRKEELLAGLAQVLPKNVWQYVVGVPRLASFGRRFVLQGGTQYNLAAVKAQVDYIRERVPDAEVFVHPHAGEAGAIGAALEALRVVRRRGRSTFIGLEAAIGLRYEARNDESTRCHFCPNECSRTFIDAYRPDGTTARYISGFSCEKGTVESKEAMIALVRERQQLARKHPNLLDYEARVAFQPPRRKPDPMPEAGTPIEDWVVERTFWGRTTRRRIERPFARSGAQAAERRRRIRIGMPRVLNMYSTAPFWNGYFLALGLDARNLVWSDETSEEMWLEGCKYGSVDPCFPAKVVQAHFHQLLMRIHPERRLDILFFPILTHLPPFLAHAVDHASCPIVAGTPEVMKAAFTKEKDWFGERGIRYVDAAFSFTEPVLLKRRLYETFGPLLEITEDESDFAAEQGWAALRAFDADLQARGRAILDEVERDNRIALLVVGRPYHSDPGLHHGIPDEFQALGYPILSVRSIPRDPEYLRRFFEDDVRAGRIRDPLDVRDVWPEAYSANSAAKVWAVRFATRHPHVALLDLSSFKCGHDAPTYGIVEALVRESGVPHAALHDLDANKPGGSIKIRVKTYAHSLRLQQERLEDLARKKAELARRIDEKRLELLRLKQRQLAARHEHDSALAAEIEALRRRLEALPAPSPAPAEPTARPEPLVRLGRKSADGRVLPIGP
ncbi:MAG: BadF/BadG/BcrA/BcrD ATPase family protein [Myxococcales bacterium]|nr:BadF/BadG/BcrA/BcrD ATPase family protein [Myxococcales bacterium]